MACVDLILLGIVKARPQSAYDVNKQIQYRNLHHWVKVGKATVFKNLATLEKKGYLSGAQQQAGKMPPKTVYTLTPAGEEHFRALMHAQAVADIGVLFDFNTVVANTNKLPPQEGLRLLRQIEAGVHAKLGFIERMQPKRAEIPLVGRGIMRQQVMVLRTLAEWFDEFISEYKAEYSITKEEKETQNGST